MCHRIGLGGRGGGGGGSEVTVSDGESVSQERVRKKLTNRTLN